MGTKRKPLGLDPEAREPAIEEQAIAPADPLDSAGADPAEAGPADDRPRCPVHGPMVRDHATAMLQYYRCPKCRRRDKRVRPIGPLKDRYGHGRSANRRAAP